MTPRLMLAIAALAVAATPLAASASTKADVCALIPHVAFINPDPTAPVRTACEALLLPIGR